MKKIFSLFAAVLMAGSMMAENGWIKFSDVQPATEVAGSTYGSNGFTLVIPSESDKASVDANDCTFGLSAEETVSFTHRLKTGGASTKDGRKFTLNIPEEGTLIVYARTSSKDATDRSFFITNGSDTIVKHICLDTDTVEDASSKIFLPVIKENVPAGSYTITYNNGINFYGFQMPVEEEEEPAESELLCNLTFPNYNSGKIGNYTSNWSATVNGETWNIVNFNNNNNVWNLIKCGSKSAASVASITTPDFKANVTAIVYNFSAVANVDSAFLYTLNGQTVVAKTAVTLTAGLDSFVIENGQSKYSYKLEIHNKKASGNGSVCLDGVKVYGVPVQAAVADPVFNVAEGDYYDPQTIYLSCETEGVAFFYTTDGTTPTSASSLYMPAYGIVLSAGTTTIKAIAYNNDSDNPEYSDVVTKTYTIAPVYNSFDELVNQAGAPAGQKVVVNFENVVIDSLYTTKAGNVNGVYLTAAGRMVEIFCYNVPAEWEVGGTISGTVKGEWKEYNGIWEVCPSSWDGITYQAVLTFEVEAGTTTFTVTPSDLEVEYYISVIPAVDEDDVPYTKEVLVPLIDGIIDDMGAGLEYFSGVQTQSYEEDWYVDEPGDYIIIVCGINAGHSARTSDVIITPFTFSTATAIDNVEAVKATKTIENGNIVIIKNGIRYNAVGAKL